MHEDDRLGLARVLEHLLVADLVHDLEPLKGFLHGDADELLLQGARAEAVVKHEQALGRVDAEERSDVLKVWQRR